MFGVTILIPFARTCGYASATSCELVLSTSTTFAGAAAKYSIIFDRERCSCVDESRLLARFEKGRAVYCWL